MRRITWQKNLRAWVATFGVAVLAGFGGQSLVTNAVVIAAEDLVKDAATVDDVAKVLDLRTLPVMDGAKLSDSRQLGTLTYEIEVDLKKSFEFHQKQFLKLGWKEMPGSRSEVTYCTANFQKSNFVVTVMSYDGAMPDKPKSSRIFINNLGNIRLAKLPVVKGAKTLYSGDAGVSYTTDLKLAEAGATTRKLLLDTGWEPYGSHDNPPDSVVHTFKRNAIKLTAFVSVAPAQGGKIAISLNETVMSADIPAPPNAEDVVFSDTTKTLDFMTPDTDDDVAKFYQQRLAKLGWKSPTENAIKAEGKFKRTTATQYFRNEAKDFLSLNVQRQEGAREGRGRVRLTHLTSAEFAAMEKREKEAAEKLVAENKAREEAAAEKAAAQKETKKKMSKADDGFPDVDALIKQKVAEALNDSGLGTDKAAKTAKKLKAAAAKDVVVIPTPAGTKKTSQTGDNVLQFKLPAGKGQQAAESLRDQLVAADWEVDDDDDEIDETSGNVSFKKDGKSLKMTFVDTGLADVNLMLIGIGVKLNPGKADSKVKIAESKTKPKTEGDEPDEKPTKKMAKKKSRSDSDDSPTASPVVVEPKRVEKPKRDIAKLSKLPNDAKVVVNDEPINLSHLVAYEVISGDRWVTKVVASEKPIRQASILAALQKTGTDEGLDIESPRITLELDDQDNPDRMSYTGGMAIGSANESELTGSAIVEEGRARGTFKSKKASEFFGRMITGEISFDLPVLTRGSQPIKQLANAKKLETAGSLVINNDTKKLANFVAYQTKSSDEIQTVIFFSEKPINIAKLKAALAKDGSDSDYFDFSSQVKVTIDKNDKISFLNLYADGASINQNTGLVGDVIVEDGRARGTVKLGEEIDFAGKKINFDLTFDLDVLKLPSTAKE